MIARRAALVTYFLSVTTPSAFGQGNISQTSMDSPAQTTPYAPTLTFDVASFRECPPGPQNNGFNNPLHSGRLTGTCDWVVQLIGWAYGVDSHTQVIGGPDWVQFVRSNEVRFDVQATADSATDDKPAKLSDQQAKLEKQHKLQALLADRFGLRAHLETRQEPAFALTVSKYAAKLQKGEPMGPKPEHGSGMWQPPITSHRDPRGIAIVAHGASMGELVKWLQFYLGKRFIDQSGITGTYNFTLQFHGTLSDKGMDEGSMRPPIETAISGQLGLKLRDSKAPTQVLVIDHVERPSPN